MTNDAARNRLRLAWPFAALVVAIIISATSEAVFAQNTFFAVAVPAFAIAMMLPTVLIALHHAETVAQRIGEPYGTLLLTLAVTIIEVAIIVSVMMHGENNPTLARESVFSVVMIVCSGGVGLCLTLGALRYGVQDHRPQGTSSFLAVLMALSVLTLVLPDFTISTLPGTFSTTQMAFVSVLSVLLYAAFLYMQSSRHRADFIDAGASESTHASLDTQFPIAVHVIALGAGLVGVVLLAERVAAGVEDGLAALGVTRTDPIIGALIASMLLFPEMLSAIRAALRNELQRSINVMLGSALATIALTIPAVAFVSLFTGRELTLGLNGRDEVMLALTLALSVVSFGTGRTNVMTGLVHLVVFFAYLLLIFIP